MRERGRKTMCMNKIFECRKILCCVLAMCMIAGILGSRPMQTEAATISSKLPISCYTLYGQVTTYTTSSLSKKSGYIASGDLCVIKSMYSNGAVKVEYPVAKGKKTAYALTSAFFKNDFSSSTRTLGKRMTAYRRATGSASIGTVYASDAVVVVGNNGSRTQIIYPISGGYKMGWVSGVYSAMPPQGEKEDAPQSFISNDAAISAQGGSMASTSRQSVANYMKQCATIRWTPKTSFLHWSGGRYWTAGTVYRGIPYSQNSRNTSLAEFTSNLSWGVYIGPAKSTTYLGSDCSSAVSIAYRTVNSSFPITNTKGLYPKSSYMKTVGSYRHDNLTDAAKICSLNSKTVMKNAYAQCQVGDLLLQNGHVMMVTGTYNGYVTTTHQTTYDSALNSSWRVDEKYTYDTLYSKKFIPVTMKAW